MNTPEKVKEIALNGSKLTFKIGKLATRAEVAVWAQLGETVLLTVLAMGKEESTMDYFPLTVEYIEKFYAGGVISGSRFLKREMRPSEGAVLKARQVDHSIRSLFPKEYKKEISIIQTVLSYDEKHDPELLATTSASLALMLSSAPFAGPCASVRVGVKGSDLLLNPDHDVIETLDGEFMVSVRDGRILNIEGWGNEVPEELMAKVLDFAVEHSKPLLKLQLELQKEVGKVKEKVEEVDISKELIKKLEKQYQKDINEALYNFDTRSNIYNDIIKKQLEEDPELDKALILNAIDYIARNIMRSGVLKDEKRSSNRKLNEVRDLEIEIGVLPRVHGSALFRRGRTQCLTILTLGSTRLVQTLESFEGEAEKRFMHHYNAPGYSMGEAGRFNYYPGRREIGHGNIGENALKAMLPKIEDFPYTIRAVSEILSQQGSSSMAASCGTSLALMDAGVPVKSQVGGVSLGLVTEDGNEKNYKLLVDIEDVEDFYGDMDFKVTGTGKGVTAIQLDNKLQGIPAEILKDAFIKSKAARSEILDAMNKIIDHPHTELSQYAPKVKLLKINPAKIGELIGPGGKVIKGILEKLANEVEIDIKDDGSVTITAEDVTKIAAAEEFINNIVMEAQVGMVYSGIVDKLAPYGAFVDVSPSISGLLHVSEMSDKFVKDPAQILKEGQEVKVKVKGINDDGRISFTMKGLNEEDTKQNSLNQSQIEDSGSESKKDHREFPRDERRQDRSYGQRSEREQRQRPPAPAPAAIRRRREARFA